MKTVLKPESSTSILRSKIFISILALVIVGISTFMLVTENSTTITVLMYHYIAKDKDNYLCVSPETFEEQMQFLKDNNIQTLTMDEFYDIATNKKKAPKRSVVITFDDGYANNFYKAYPILKKYNFNATLFMITKNIGEKYFLNESNIKEMDKDNIKVMSHTISHPYLEKLSEEEQTKELKESKERLEKLLGRNVEYLAYPHGTYSDKTIEISKSLGYKMALTTNYDFHEEGEDPFKISRLVVFEDMKDFKKHALISRKHIFKMKLKKLYNDIKSPFKNKEKSA